MTKIFKNLRRDQIRRWYFSLTITWVVLISLNFIEIESGIRNKSWHQIHKIRILLLFWSFYFTRLTYACQFIPQKEKKNIMLVSYIVLNKAYALYIIQFLLNKIQTLEFSWVVTELKKSNKILIMKLHSTHKLLLMINL